MTVPVQNSARPRIRSAEDMLCFQVRAAMKVRGITQVEAAKRLNVSHSHLARMLGGETSLHLHWAERILTMCGMRLVIGVQIVVPE